MRAHLICPQLVTVLPLARGASLEDPLAGEPYLQARGATFQLLAQVDELTENERRPGQGGATVPYSHQLTFRARDVAGATWSPTDGDQVVAVADRRGGGARAVRWYLTRPRGTGKGYGSGPQLVTMVASSRPPSREPTEGL